MASTFSPKRVCVEQHLEWMAANTSINTVDASRRRCESLCAFYTNWKCWKEKKNQTLVLLPSMWIRNRWFYPAMLKLLPGSLHGWSMGVCLLYVFSLKCIQNWRKLWTRSDSALPLALGDRKPISCPQNQFHIPNNKSDGLVHSKSTNTTTNKILCRGNS